MIFAYCRELGKVETANQEVPGSLVFDTTANGQPPSATFSSDTFAKEAGCVKG